MRTPRHLYMVTVHHIIRYLLGTLGKGIFFLVNSSLKLVGYNNVDLTASADTHHLIIGWCMFLGVHSFLSEVRVNLSIELCLLPIQRLFSFKVF